MSDKEVFSVREAADELGVTRISVYKWIQHGWIDPVETGSKAIRISKKEVSRVKDLVSRGYPVSAKIKE